MARLETYEHEGQTEAHHVVEVYGVLASVARGQHEEAAEVAVGHFYYGIVRLGLLAEGFLLLRSLHYQIDSVVLQFANLRYVVQPDGVCGPVELVEVEVPDVLLLLLVEVVLVEEPDVVVFEQTEHVVGGLGVFRAVCCVQLVYGLDGLFQPFALLLGVLVGRLKQSVERCHPDAEELVEVVGVYAEKRETFEQWHAFLLRLLEDAVVEIHPAHVAVHVSVL